MHEAKPLLLFLQTHLKLCPMRCTQVAGSCSQQSEPFTKLLPLNAPWARLEVLVSAVLALPLGTLDAFTIVKPTFGPWL